VLQTDEEINTGTHPEKKTVLLNERDIRAKPPPALRPTKKAEKST